MADITVSKEEWDRVIEMLDQANKAIESAPKWISVKERLPEPGDRVLVAVACGFVAEAFVNKSGVWMRNGFEMDWYPPTHWMPLPEPPKEEGGENG